MAGGRPLKFESVESLEQAINEYFRMCDVNERPYTITGLAVALDTSRQTLINYEKREEFFDAIKRAKTKVECFAEERLFTPSPTGAIFALKNFGWSDKPVVSEDTDKAPDSITVTVQDASKNADT